MLPPLDLDATAASPNPSVTWRTSPIAVVAHSPELKGHAMTRRLALTAVLDDHRCSCEPRQASHDDEVHVARLGDDG